MCKLLHLRKSRNYVRRFRFNTKNESGAMPPHSWMSLDRHITNQWNKEFDVVRKKKQISISKWHPKWHAVVQQWMDEWVSVVDRLGRRLQSCSWPWFEFQSVVRCCLARSFWPHFLSSHCCCRPQNLIWKNKNEKLCSSKMLWEILQPSQCFELVALEWSCGSHQITSAPSRLISWEITFVQWVQRCGWLCFT